MNWQTVVEAIGIFGVGSGLFTWMIQSLAKQALSLGILRLPAQWCSLVSLALLALGNCDEPTF
jgi:hypothetical protein